MIILAQSGVLAISLLSERIDCWEGDGERSGLLLSRFTIHFGFHSWEGFQMDWKIYIHPGPIMPGIYSIWSYLVIWCVGMVLVQKDRTGYGRVREYFQLFTTMIYRILQLTAFPNKRWCSNRLPTLPYSYIPVYFVDILQCYFIRDFGQRG